MVSVSLLSLSELCHIRIAYLMWTRRNFNKYKRIASERVETLFDQLIDVVSADVQKLPLPEKMKLRIFQIVKPAGQRLLRLLDLWLTKTQPENPHRWLTGEMLHESLVLNGDGQINERKTAEKMLSCERMTRYSVIYQFRLACVNFLEKQVLNLWILSKQRLLYKISTDPLDGQTLSFFPSRNILGKKPKIFGRCKYIYVLKTLKAHNSQCTTEPDEVLFWVGYCLARENATSIKNVPHFVGEDVDWYEFSLESAALSGSGACLDYFINICKMEVEYSYVGMIILKFYREECKYDQACFVSHFMLLDLQQRAELIRKYPHFMMCHFLQWPLSQTFVENAEEIWKLIPDHYKDWLFLKIFSIIFRENPLLNPISSNTSFCGLYVDSNVIYNDEHLRRIWIALWGVSSDSFKMTVLNSVVFKSITHSKRRREFRTQFRDSGLKNKLLELFLSNGEAILEFYEGKTIKRSIRNLVAEYMPEDFEDLYRGCISFLKTEDKKHREKMRSEMHEKVMFQMDEGIDPSCEPKPIHDKFLNYIKEVVYSEIEKEKLLLLNARIF